MEGSSEIGAGAAVGSGSAAGSGVGFGGLDLGGGAAGGVGSAGGAGTASSAFAERGLVGGDARTLEMAPRSNPSDPASTAWTTSKGKGQVGRGPSD